MVINLNTAIELEKKAKCLFINTHYDMEILFIAREDAEAILGRKDLYRDDEDMVLLKLHFVETDQIEVYCYHTDSWLEI